MRVRIPIVRGESSLIHIFSLFSLSLSTRWYHDRLCSMISSSLDPLCSPGFHLSLSLSPCCWPPIKARVDSNKVRKREATEWRRRSSTNLFLPLTWRPWLSSSSIYYIIEEERTVLCNRTNIIDGSRPQSNGQLFSTIQHYVRATKRDSYRSNRRNRRSTTSIQTNESIYRNWRSAISIQTN